MKTTSSPALLFAAVALVTPLPAQTTQPATAARTFISASECESDLGFRVNLSGSIIAAETGHHYEVLYQFRVHTRQGEIGPLLGDAQNPSGRAFVLGEVTALANSECGFEFFFDLTRKDLSTLTLLTKGRMLLRIEPQVYDKTTQRYVTPPKTPALIAVAMITDQGRAGSLVPFAKWFASCSGPSSTDTALTTLAALDAIDFEGNAIVPAFEAVFGNPDVKAKELVKFLAALPAAELAFGKNNLRWHMDGLGKHADAAVRAAAAAKQKEASALAERR